MTHTLGHRGLRPISELAATRPHGTRLRYLAGCHCSECRRANARYESERAQARRRGEWNGLVSAAPARAHILKLAKAGLGRRSIADAADIRVNTIGEIRRKEKTRIRAHTAQRILAVTPDMASDRCLVPATQLWARIRRLLDEGYTKHALARALGYRRPAIQFGKRRVTARNDYEVKQLYDRLTT